MSSYRTVTHIPLLTACCMNTPLPRARSTNCSLVARGAVPQAGSLDDAAVMHRDSRVDQMAPKRAKHVEALAARTPKRLSLHALAFRRDHRATLN
jgi:hypothetical protein